MSMNAGQCRAARALLGWSQGDLCDAAKVGRATLANFESEKTTPYERTLRDIEAALEAAGVAFLDAGSTATGAGVSLLKSGNSIDVDDTQTVQYRESLRKDAPPGGGG